MFKFAGPEHCRGTSHTLKHQAQMNSPQHALVTQKSRNISVAQAADTVIRGISWESIMRVDILTVVMNVSFS